MATYDFYIRQGDRLPAISGTLRDANGTAVTLEQAPAAVEFNMRHKETNEVAVAGGTVTFDHTDGTWSYEWGANDTALAGLHMAEVELTVNDKTQTFPSYGSISVYVDRQMG